MNTTIAVISIVAALGLLGVVAITLVTIPLQLQQAEAVGCEFGSMNYTPISHSNRRCLGH
jgi:hypothetical protein